MEKVSFKIAKALKEAGYPQAGKEYYDAFGNLAYYKAKSGIEFFEAPTYFDVWLWLWREKEIKIVPEPRQKVFVYIKAPFYGLPKEFASGFEEPEEAIIAAIEYLVDNNLIMNKYLAKENEKKAVGIGLHVRDLCLSKGVTRDNAETAALVAQQSAMEMAKWKDNQAAYAYCKCCNECSDYGIDICNKLEDFMTIMKGGKK